MGCQKYTVKDLDPGHINTWCPGCGDFAILAGLRKAVITSCIDLKDLVVVSGIGCSGKLPHYLTTYAFEGIHGRALPLATGIKLANKDLKVVVVGGDGDGYGIGAGHFVHTMRRNLDMTYIVHNNEIYGLTKGQYSPTTEPGHVTPTTPHGAIETPVHPLALALTLGATFVARGYSGNIKQLSELIQAGMKHKGIAIIDVIQPCPSWQKELSFYYYEDKVYDVAGEGWNVKDKLRALDFFMQEDLYHAEKIATGIFYREERPTYGDELKINDKETPVALRPIDNIDIGPLLDAFK